MSVLTIIGLILLAGGLAGIFLIVAKKIPTLVKLQEIQTAPQTGLAERVKIRLKSIRYSTYRPLVLEWLEKNLRKFRLLILKIDNLFISLIKYARERSQVWKIRSGAWMEHTRLKKKEKLQVLEKLDKVEVSESLEKMKEEVAKDEDKALKEKIEIVANGNGSIHFEEEFRPVQESTAGPVNGGKESGEVTEGEKKYIDLIAANPKDREAYRALGFLYLNQKNYSDARACFRRVLKLNPQDEEVKNKLNEIKGLRAKKPR